jgi:hypothetical protein
MTSLELEEVRVHQPYTVETVHAALTAYATTGNYDTAEQLTGVDQATVRYWRKKYPNRYQHCADQVAPHIDKTAAAGLRENILAAQAALTDAIQEEHARITKGDVKDAAASGRNLATIMGISVDKLFALEGRPTTTILHITGDDAIRQLAVAGMVEEIPDAEEPPNTETPPNDNPTSAVSSTG